MERPRPGHADGMPAGRAHGLTPPAQDPGPPDPRLLDRFGAAAALREGVVPWRWAGGATLVLATDGPAFARNRDRLEDLFGPVIPALAAPSALEAAVLRLRGPALDRAARSRVAAEESCRGWTRGGPLPWALLLGLSAVLVYAPGALVGVVALWALATLALATALKIAAAVAALRRPPPEGEPPLIARWPVVSILVPLFRERRIAARLVARLARLDYPRDRLDVILIVEEADRPTREALDESALPPWMRVVTVPDGPLKTKPRALNHALGLARGSIVGVYDAEDAPAPDQVTRVVERFHRRGPQVACLQGVLDFYNPRSNWIARCFTIEYAAWFRLMLPGLARLGLPVPLGGTTLFFRRAALEALGGWDAHNVTEDADLGIRLARHGYRTELIDTVTEEEANCRPIPWVRQRSRWLKGYMMTYAVHMRRPRLLRRQLGWWRFAGFQVFFLTTLSQFLLAPVLWLFWLAPWGLAPVPPGPGGPLLFGLFLVAEATLLGVNLVAMRLTPNRMNPAWVLMLHLYFPLATAAALKALWETVACPFWWDKTSHGHHDPAAPPGPPARSRISPASIRSRVS